MQAKDIFSFLQSIAPICLQEDYDNSGLLIGDHSTEITGILIALDLTSAIVEEAIAQKINCIITHHPLIFRGLKKLSSNSDQQKAIILAIKHDICIYSAHTNLDNVLSGVNGMIATKLLLKNPRVLLPKEGFLQKLSYFVPVENHNEVLNAVFAAGAGEIGNYANCSFTTIGTGSFLPNERATPAIGQTGKRSEVEEKKVEVIFESWKERAVLDALFSSHPYEEVAHDIYTLKNSYQNIGSGIIGDLEEEVDFEDFSELLHDRFNLKSIRYRTASHKKIKRVAACGGAGVFLLRHAINAGADVFITADVKYHDFFETNQQITLVDIGHFESEQFTIDLIYDLLIQKFPNFAILKTKLNTNPVEYKSWI